jgi:hypothetical protein
MSFSPDQSLMELTAILQERNRHKELLGQAKNQQRAHWRQEVRFLKKTVRKLNRQAQHIAAGLHYGGTPVSSIREAVAAGMHASAGES